MTIRKISKGRKMLEKAAGGPLTLHGLIQAIRLCEEMPLAPYAKLLDISVSHLSDIEHGRKVVTPERAVRFAKALKHSEEQFVRLALQDMLNRAGIKLEVQVEKTA